MRWLNRKDIVVAINITQDDVLECGVSASRQVVKFLADTDDRAKEHFVEHVTNSISRYLEEAIKRIRAEKVN